MLNLFQHDKCLMCVMYKKISEEVVHKNPWWVYKHDTFEMPDGTIGNYYYGEKPGGVLIIPVTADGRLVLVRQHRYVHNKFSVEFPIGAIEAGESPNEAAHRELKEEIKQDAENLISVGTFEPSNGLFKDQFHVFVARDLFKATADTLDSTEEIEILERRPDEFDDMIKRGEIWDGETLAAWTLARPILFV